MQEQKISNTERVWWSSQWLTDPVDKVFSLDYWSAEHRVVGSAQGRGTTWFIQMAKLTAALRHYYRGGLLGKVITDQYVFLGWRSTRSYREFQLLNHMQQAGINVPCPIAARAIRRGLFYRADLLSEKIENSEDLVTVLTRRSLTPAEYHAIGSEIAKMHRLFISHSDLNIHNILLDKQGKVWLIDFDKCSQENNDKRWPEKNLARLKRSFIKEQGKRNIHWQTNDFEQLLAGYRS